MITLKKGDAVKYIDPSSTLIPVLKADGWKAESKIEVVQENNDLESLRAEAEALGIKADYNDATAAPIGNNSTAITKLSVPKTSCAGSIVTAIALNSFSRIISVKFNSASEVK